MLAKLINCKVEASRKKDIWPGALKKPWEKMFALARTDVVRQQKEAAASFKSEMKEQAILHTKETRRTGYKRDT